MNADRPRVCAVENEERGPTGVGPRSWDLRRGTRQGAYLPVAFFAFGVALLVAFFAGVLAGASSDLPRLL